MKNFVSRLLGQPSDRNEPEPAKLGSNDDPIRQMLFASQSLKEQVARMQLNGALGPLATIAEAAKWVDAGQKSEAIAQLRSVLEMPQLETRLALWVWSALRELGVEPDATHAFEVLGAIIEVPSHGAYDTLAAYSDGTARYLNFSGHAIFWDTADAQVHALCRAFVNSTIPASSRATPRTDLSLPQTGARVTLLTRAGNYAFDNPPDPVFRAGAALMLELIHRTEKKSA